MNACCNCNRPFEKKKKGYKRTDLELLASPRTVGLTFPDLDPENHSFICYPCVRVLRSKTIPNGRKRTFPPPDTSAASLKQRRVAQNKKIKKSSIDQAITYLKSRLYLKAMRALFNTDKLRKPILEIVCKALIQEVNPI